METKYFTTPNGLNLLTEWDNDFKYLVNTKRAKSAAARLFKSGVLVFEYGDKPRTVAEFFDGMPYTSTSDFAAVWACCNWQISRRGNSALRFEGVALTDRHAVAVWTRYDDNGKEVETVYEVIER